jgi:protein-S-isoprenylcysteine O-methyltransferase Ste14
MFPFNKVIIACWIIFWLYWLISAFGAKRNTKLRLEKFAGIRIGIFLAAIVLFRFLNVQNYSFQNRVSTDNELVLTIGFIIFLVGLFTAIWARVHLGRNWGMPMSTKQNPELVTSGPYCYLRHPIYTGILLAMIGSSLASSLVWLTVFAITGIYFVYSAVEEEKLMMKQFPKVYPSYKSKTKMFIPFIF